jgi:hypothetical protein
MVLDWESNVWLQESTPHTLSAHVDIPSNADAWDLMLGGQVIELISRI